MAEDIFKGKWNEVKGKVKQQWGNITDNDLQRISGKKDELLGILQQRYGYDKARAKMELDDFIKRHKIRSKL